jgi:hypothetical protein
MSFNFQSLTERRFRKFELCVGIEGQGEEKVRKSQGGGDDSKIKVVNQQL